VIVEVPDSDAATDLGDLWVELAAEQCQHGSHLLAERNRASITENIRRAIVARGMYVARAGADDDVGAGPGTILGFVMFTSDTEVMATDATRGTIENLYVRPDYRDQEIGSQLIAAAEAALAERGVDVIKLEVLAANDAARRFYRRHGYEPHRVQLEKPAESDNHSKD